jgi:hypothetical protein
MNAVVNIKYIFWSVKSRVNKVTSKKGKQSLYTPGHAVVVPEG